MRTLSKEHRLKLSLSAKMRSVVPPSQKGKKRTLETKQKLSKALKGVKRGKPSEQHRYNLSLAHKGKKLTLEHRQKLSVAKLGKYCGENSWNWQGGLTPKNAAIRNSTQYKQWRKLVFERDNYTCVSCSVRGVVLHADHIKPFAKYAELRFNADNGRTLCIGCHELTPTYKGRTRVTKQSMEQI